MLENEIVENVTSWKDNEFIKELDAEYNDWKAKGHTTDEVKEHIGQLSRIGVIEGKA